MTINMVSLLSLTNLVDVYDGIIMLWKKEEKLMPPTWDLCKAFDAVSHDILVSKLRRHGFDITQWIKKLTGWPHSKRQLISGSKSKQGPVTSIIPQGSISGAGLFNTFLAT